MKINFTHNIEQLLQMFQNFSHLLRTKLYTVGVSKTFQNDVKQAINSEIDKLGLMSRAIALKKSFKILSPEVTSNGVIYRIRSESSQIRRLNAGTAPDAKYTIGARRLADGTFAGTLPTRIGDKIGKNVYKVLYKHITTAVNNASNDVLNKMGI